MKLQIALDRLTYDECFHILGQVHESVDIIEIGTGVIKEFGLGIVKSVKERYPEKEILADMKICDAGQSESEQAFQYGADIITVMSFADQNTIRSCLETADAHGGEVVVDLLNNSKDSVLNTLRQIGVKSVSAHIGKDQQKNADASPGFEALNPASFKVYMAGGINAENVRRFSAMHPSVIIVGSGITKAEDKEAQAALIKSIIE